MATLVDNEPLFKGRPLPSAVRVGDNNAAGRGFRAAGLLQNGGQANATLEASSSVALDDAYNGSIISLTRVRHGPDRGDNRLQRR